MNFSRGNISKVGSVRRRDFAQYHPVPTGKIGIENLDGADHQICMRVRCSPGDPNNRLILECSKILTVPKELAEKSNRGITPRPIAHMAGRDGYIPVCARRRELAYIRRNAGSDMERSVKIYRRRLPGVFDRLIWSRYHMR